MWQILLTILLINSSMQGDKYAVLIAGSSGFSNYRHQADICHAYHTLISKGVSANNIIVFSYNDAAKSSYNPFPNQLFNRPTYEKEGVDVNDGCVIDYERRDVSVANFVNVLLGNKAMMNGIGSGRVLESGADDDVFLYFADHGASGLIAFPHEYMYAPKLMSTFQKMHDTSKYSQLVFYLEACESGSMFAKLPKDINIYAVSAASPSQSSWAYYCYPDDQVNGKHIGSCLGDMFSIKMLEDSDVEQQETLQEQYQRVKQETTKSQVMQWGTLNFTDELVDQFIGDDYTNAQPLPELKNVSSIDSRLSYLHFLQTRHALSNTMSSYMELQKEMQVVQRYKQIFTKLMESTKDMMKPDANSLDYDCVEHIVNEFEARCGPLPRSQLGYVSLLGQLCNYPSWKVYPGVIIYKMSVACRT